MDPKIKAEWIAALRSGKYKQGLLRLRSLDDKFCCLGVLADACLNADWQKAIDGYDVDCFTHSPPDSVLDQAGLSPVHAGILMAMNDIQGKTFDEIADWIEENL